MKQFPLFLFAFLTLSFSACDDDDTPEEGEALGTIEIEFENVIGPQDSQRSFSISEVGATEYPYQNGMNQAFNVTLLKYYVSEVVLTGPNGERFEEPLSVSATEANGYHLIDAADPNSLTFDLTDVPAGQYNKISFLLGVDSTGVLEGAAGGELDPATSGMFWSWNSGYVAVKVEGQSPASPGGARGNSIEQENEAGWVYHIGGWKDIPESPFVNNNQRVELTFDEAARVGRNLDPTAHFEMNVAGLLDGPERTLDFTVDAVQRAPPGGYGTTCQERGRRLPLRPYSPIAFTSARLPFACNRQFTSRRTPYEIYYSIHGFPHRGRLPGRRGSTGK